MPSYFSPYLAYEADEADETDELFGEADEADEADEAARRPQRRMRAPIRTPQRGGNLPPRPATGFATRTELAVAIKNVDTKIGQLSTGVKALDGRVRSVDSEQGKLRSSLAAEAKKREALASQVNNLQQMSMILPLLTTPVTRTVNDPAGVQGTNLQQNDKVVIESSDSLSSVLPMLLFAGAGSSGQPGSGGMFGGGDNNMMTLALMMMAIKK